MLTKPADRSTLCAFFGGTFDPIHYGHLKAVTALAKEVGLAQVTLLPNHVPPHRPQPIASPQQRVDMVSLAIANSPLFVVDDRELQRCTPSYTIHTLESIRKERGHSSPLAFIIGQDTLLTLHQWYRWQDLLDVCHLLVLARPGYGVQMATPEMQHWLEQHQLKKAEQLTERPYGAVYLATTPLLEISATDIRKSYHQHLDCKDLLPPAVQDYIELQGLYR